MRRECDARVFHWKISSVFMGQNCDNTSLPRARAHARTHTPLNAGQIVINHTHQSIEAVVDAMTQTDNAAASLRGATLRGGLNGSMGAA